METRFGTGVSLWLGQDVLVVGSLEIWHKFLHACTRFSVSTLATLGHCVFWGVGPGGWGDECMGGDGWGEVTGAGFQWVFIWRLGVPRFKITLLSHQRN